TAALAAAFAGDPATARAWLAEAKAAVEAAAQPPALVLPNGITGFAAPTVDKAAQAAELSRYAALVEAAILHQAGDAAAARAAAAKLGTPPAAPAAAQALARIAGQDAPAAERGQVDARLL